MVALIAPSGDTGGGGGGAPTKGRVRDQTARWEEAAAAAEAAERQRELEKGAAEALAGGLFRAFDAFPPPNGGTSHRLYGCLCVHLCVCSKIGMFNGPCACLRSTYTCTRASVCSSNLPHLLVVSVQLLHAAPPCSNMPCAGASATLCTRLRLASTLLLCTH